MGNNILAVPTPSYDFHLVGDELEEWLTSVVLNDEDGLVVVLKASIDESGTHDSSPLVCVAACVATSRQWRLLMDEWAEFVSPLVPEGKTYHAKQKRYDGASETLARLIVRRMSLVCAVTVDKADYKAHAPDRFRSIYGGNAYSLAVHALLFYIGHWCHRRGKQKVAYVLESGAKGQAFLETTFSNCMKPPLRDRVRVHSYAWVGKEDPIVQAPDLVSHEIMTCSKVPATKVYNILDRKLVLHHLDKEGIADAVSQVWAGEREEKQARKKLKEQHLGR